MGSTACTIEYDSKDIFWCTDELDKHPEIEKLTLNGKEYDVIMPNRNWCCGAGYSAWKCSENDFLYKHKEHGWLFSKKPIELQKPFLYLHFEFCNQEVLLIGWDIINKIEKENNLDRKNHRGYYSTHHYIFDAKDLEKLTKIKDKLLMHKDIFTNVEIQTEREIKKDYNK